MCNGEKKALNKFVTYTVMYTESKRSNVCNRKYNTVYTCVTENIILYLQQKTAVCVSEKRKRRTKG